MMTLEKIKYQIRNFFLRIKWSLQKIFRRGHCSDRNLWNLDIYLAKIILPKLIAFKSMPRVGYPALLRDENEWEKILDEMIFAFKYVLADAEIKRKEFEKEYGEINQENYIKFEKRAQKGFELFGLYFRSLWD